MRFPLLSRVIQSVTVRRLKFGLILIHFWGCCDWRLALFRFVVVQTRCFVPIIFFFMRLVFVVLFRFFLVKLRQRSAVGTRCFLF